MAQHAQVVHVAAKHRRWSLMPKASSDWGTARGRAAKTQKLPRREAGVAEIETSVDLTGQKVTLTTQGQTLEAALKRPLKSITHVGYCTLSAVTDFGSPDIAGE